MPVGFYSFSYSYSYSILLSLRMTVSSLQAVDSVTYCTMMCGADSNTVTVAMIVNRVKTIKQNRSTTIAANFQSLIKSASSSRFFMRPVMNCSSFRIKCRSLCEHPLIECSSTVVGRLNLFRGSRRKEINLIFQSHENNIFSHHHRQHWINTRNHPK